MRFLLSNYMIAFYILAGVLLWILSGVLSGDNGNEVAENIEKSIEIDKSGKANSVELTVNNPDLKGRYLRLNNLGISALKRTSFEPQRVNGVPEKSFLIRKVKYPKNVCST